MAVLVFVLGATLALFVNGYFLIKREGISLAHCLPFFLGIAALFMYFLAFIGVYYGNEYAAIRYLIPVTFWYISLVAYVGFNLAAYLLQALIHSRWPKTNGYQGVVVLGSGIREERVTPLLASRLDRGLAIARKNQAQYFVCSGGQGVDEPIPEAEAMRRYVHEKAPGEFRIVVEDKSTTTRENLLFSDSKLADVLPSDTKVAVATSNYHALRAAAIVRQLGLSWDVYGAPTALYYVPSAFLREFVAAMELNWRIHAIIVAVFTIVVGYLTYYAF
ncbi:YdcF family protein [Corynebacterium kutscheri]|nr:YdcF family protein [Corynebacterium kutscheri]